MNDVCRASVSGEHEAAQQLLRMPGLALATARHAAVLRGWRSLPACFTGTVDCRPAHHPACDRTLPR